MANKQIVLGGKSVERCELVDSNGVLMGVLEYDPGDAGVLNRYPEFESRVNSPELAQKIEQIDELRANGVRENAETIAQLMYEIEEEIASAMDVLLNIDSRKTCFSIKRPLWIHRIETDDGVDEAYWFQRIMIAVTNIVREFNEKRIAAKIAKINAATVGDNR